MQKVFKSNSTPETSIITKDFGKIDHCDSYQTCLIIKESVDEITTKIFKVPQWVDLLMRIRDSIVRPLGLKNDKEKSFSEGLKYEVGLKAGLFQVIDRNDNEIVMAENDKHLNFRTSVMVMEIGDESVVSLTTIVRFNNIFGRVYFLPVKPFHQMIIRSILRRLQ